MTPLLAQEQSGGVDRAVRVGLMLLLSALVGLLLVLGLWLEGPAAHGSERGALRPPPAVVPTTSVLGDKSPD
jgi:hypothetical protein